MLSDMFHWVFAPITCYESAVCGALGFLCGCAWFATKHLGRIADALDPPRDSDMRPKSDKRLH